MIIHPRSPSEVAGIIEEEVMKHLAPEIIEESGTEGSCGDVGAAIVSVGSASPGAVEREVSLFRGFRNCEKSDIDLWESTELNSLSTPRPLRSALRSSFPVRRNAHQAQRLRRSRVHGLWGEDAAVNPFALLHDSLLAEIVSSFLDLEDLCRCQCVSQRFASIARGEKAWRHIDATSFVQTLYRYFDQKQHRNPAEATTELLVQKWQAKTPFSIRINNIGHCLDAHTFCLPTNTKRLQLLSLSHFGNLTDTHVHVLLLSSNTNASYFQTALPVALRGNLNCINHRHSSLTHPWSLQSLILEQCPRLTNASIRSIANMCDQLQELDVSGCPLVDDLSPLKPLWKLQRRADLGSLAASASLAHSERSMRSLQVAPGTTTGTNPSPDVNVKTFANLQSIFVPPPSSSVPKVATSTSVQSLNNMFSSPPVPPATNKPPAAAKNDLAALFVHPPFIESRTTMPISSCRLVLKSPTKSNGAVNNAVLGSLLPPPPAARLPSLASLSASPDKDSASLFSEGVQSLGNSLASLRYGTVSNSSYALASLDPLRRQPIMKLGKELCRIHVNNTGVTPELLIRCFAEAASMVDGSNVIALESLLGAVIWTGDKPQTVWDDSHLRALTRVINPPLLRCLDISCHAEYVQRRGDEMGRVTDASLLSLFRIANDYDTAPMLQLHKLHIMGHPLVTECALESIRKASVAPSLIVRR